MPLESAWEIINELGNLGQVHIVDYDIEKPLIHRSFANYVKRCDHSLN